MNDKGEDVSLGEFEFQVEFEGPEVVGHTSSGNRQDCNVPAHQ